VAKDSARTNLPIPDPDYTGLVTYDARDPESHFPPIEPLRPPVGAPNVLLIMLDDLGFGAASAFGGPCAAPVMERLAARGLRYTRFHTTALCAPTRASLLTGRNPHSVGFGSVPEIATSAPGYSTVRPKSAAPLPEVLKLNGYSTAQFGKCHEVPVWQTSPVGPFDMWPTGSGFEHFYGFIGGETNQYYPALYEGTTPVEPPKTPQEGYHLTEDLADRAIAWVRQQQSLTPDKPFFMYFAPGATHAPHHVPKQWADRYQGRFDQGWDVLREQTLARQKELGVVPPETELTARPAEIPAWADMPVELKPVLARQMEIYAGFLEHTDHHVGRLIDALGELGIADDTLILYITGDNGASAEGTVQGTFNESIVFNGAYDLETPEFMSSRIEQFGSPEAYNHFAVGWAHAMDTPYQWTKQVASHWGGTRNGLIVHWPARLSGTGEVRTQFHHVIDIAPTVLELAGIPQPSFVNGVAQKPIQGISMTYSFEEAAAADRRETQYFEMFCNRGIYHQGWTAVTRHSTPWIVGPTPSFEEDVWELYDTTTDWSQAHDLSADLPGKLHELQRLWLIEAARHDVLPLDDRRAERFNPDAAGRPQLVTGTSQKLFGEMGRLTEASLINVKNRSHAVTAEVQIPESGGQGVIVAQGGSFGGWALYVTGGRLTYCHNLLGLKRFKIAAGQPVPDGTHQVRMESDYDGGGLGQGATIRLYIDGGQVGEGRLPATVPLIFSVDETADIGCDPATPVSDDYTSRTSAFTGTVNWVQIDLGAFDADHFISPEEQFRIAMARQ
jgi:arylsulfatase A-like enzyme